MKNFHQSHSFWHNENEHRKRSFMDNHKLLKIEELLLLIVALMKNNQRNHFPIMTQKELLEQLKIAPNTLKSWEQRGLKRLEPPIEGTRCVYYKLDDVLDFLSK